MSDSTSYQLFFTPRSPFARRVRLAMRRLALPVTETHASVFEEVPELLALNPLGWVPTLRTPEGMGIFDSTAILEYLDDSTGRVWPRSMPDRTHVRQASVLATGIIQSAVQYHQETAMHEVPSPTWAKDHHETMERSIRFATNTPESLWLRGDGLTQAGWDLAVAIEYLAIRAPGIEIPYGHPLINQVMNLAKANPDFRETQPKA
ncbi:glutathione S-transferase family protein [bacterium]|nr:glutathione S-transferase family protein [bacterium]